MLSWQGVLTGQWTEIDENADVVNVLVTTGQLVPTLGKLLLFKLDGAFKATCKLSLPCAIGLAQLLYVGTMRL